MGFNFMVNYMRVRNKLLCGVGVNDADYNVQPKVNGKKAMCHFYSKWTGMLRRCYSAKLQSRQPAYIGVTVCVEWLYFSNFKLWMEKQDWHGKDLDKDLLFIGNKIYSPDTCCFIEHSTNNFVLDRPMDRGAHPTGVSFNKKSRKFESYCSNPFTKKRELLGYFNCAAQAHQTWRKRKHELACQLADLQNDERVVAALRLRYA